jgi:hypothetical protein
MFMQIVTLCFFQKGGIFPCNPIRIFPICGAWLKLADSYGSQIGSAKQNQTTPNMKKSAVFFAALAATALSASAATISYDGTIANGPNPSATFPLTTYENVTQFNPSLGTLLSVTLTIDASASAKLEGENERSGTSDFTASLVGSVTGSFSTGLSAAADTGAGSVMSASVEADDDAAPDWKGNDYKDFGTVGGSDSQSQTQTTNLSPFIGTGDIQLTVYDQQAWSVSGSGDTTSRVTDSQSSTDWTVTYNYTPVPEPASVTPLFGLLGLALLARRRK